MTSTAAQEESAERVRMFRNFWETSLEKNSAMITAALSEAEKRLEAGSDPSQRIYLDLDELRQHDQEMAQRLIRFPVDGLAEALSGLKAVLADKNWLDDKTPQEEGKSVRDNLHVGITGNLGSNFVSPRGLKSHLVGKLVMVEGIVTKISLVRPKLAKAVHYCPNTKLQLAREYRDAASLEGLPTSQVMATRDSEGNLLEFEYGLSIYRSFQRITVQEMPEKAPLGQLPRSVDVILEDDLVDRVKPGDRVKACGVYRALGGQATTRTITGLFKTLLVCNYVETLTQVVGATDLTKTDLQNIRALAQKSDVFDTLARSLAPSIYGHEYIKKALLLMLFGGMERNLANGTHLRGDINVLLVGDPSTAKSQMLRYVMGVAPLAISTTGRGSTGVGLTAAVTRDQDTGENRLEAGAMVLADRGVVLIDEFDKMSDGDRVAIHEVMEQQTVTIAKAGIHATLNSRCSVVAAANPIYGAYDKNLSPQRNVGLPDSLLSRFDLLFIVLDNLNPKHDREISEHVLRMHRYQRPGKEGVPFQINQPSMDSRRDDEEEDDPSSSRRDGDASSMYQRYNPLLHAGYASSNPNETQNLLSQEFIKKYISYAKTRIKPVLSAEAARVIQGDYTELRQEQATKTLPITPRCLETMIRLSTAHAKARLSHVIEVLDCEVARSILRFAMYNDTDTVFENSENSAKKVNVAVPRKIVGRPRDASSSSSEEEDEDNDQADSSEDDDDDDEGKPRPKRSKRSSRSVPKPAATTRSAPAAAVRKARVDPQDDQEDEMPLVSSSTQPTQIMLQTTQVLPSSSSSSNDPGFALFEAGSNPSDSVRFAFFNTSMSAFFRTKHAEELKTQDIIDNANAELRAENPRWPLYEYPEVETMLQYLEDENKIMHREGIVFWI